MLQLKLQNQTMKKLMLLASAAVFIYACFTRFRPDNTKETENVDVCVPVGMDMPLSMTVNGETYASNLPDAYYNSYMRSVMADQVYIPER